MNKELENFLNEYKDSFEDYFDKKVMVNLEKREDYKKINCEINEIFDKYSNLKDFIKDEVPVTFNQEETNAFRKLYNLYDSLKNIEILEAFKLGCK